MDLTTSLNRAQTSLGRASRSPAREQVRIHPDRIERWHGMNKYVTRAEMEAEAPGVYNLLPPQFRDCLPADVSASEFVVHMGRMSGLPHTVARERAADVLRHVGLAEERYRPMGGYSTGMKQRAKLAQALVHDPRLVLLDEPTNGLDPASRDDMLDLVRRIGTDFGISVLVTSHLLGELERVSDHVIVLDGGRLLRSSATSEFTEATGTLLVEVLGTATERDRLGQALAERGLQCHPVDNAVEVVPPPSGEVGGVDIRDLVRDTVIDLDLGLVRIQEGRHRIQDVFAIREEVPQP